MPALHSICVSDERTRCARSIKSEAGFTLVELLIASVITMVIMGVAFSTFRDALTLNESVVNLTDASQNLRAGTNLMVRDLLQAGRGIPIGGIPIPSGANAASIERPSPEDESYELANSDDGATITAIITGDGLGPTVAGRATDIVTVLIEDAFRPPLNIYAPNSPTNYARLASDGSSFDSGSTGWLAADDEDAAITAIEEGDLIYFRSTDGNALQTVTAVEGAMISFAANDPFNLNQRGTAPGTAGAIPGSITQIIRDPLPTCDDATPATTCYPIMTAHRIYMYTYYVQIDDGAPRLMRRVNHGAAQALAGVIEDLELSYDLVDGVNNIVGVGTLPHTANSVLYSANQIRKVNIRVGVRSEVKSSRTNDYVRNYLSTVVSIRNLAFVDRYQ